MGVAEKMLAPMFYALPWFVVDGDAHETNSGEEYEESWFARHLVDERTPEDDALREDAIKRLHAILDQLTPREKSILLLRAAGWTLDEIGCRMTPPVCRERVRQLQQTAMNRARAIVAEMTARKEM